MEKMKARLIKTGDQYLLRDLKGEVLAITNGTTKGRMLSLKNCQAIERGYDLDELAIDYIGEQDKKHWVPSEYNEFIAFKEGFQKALELMGDKKFTEEDMRKAVSRARMCSVIDEYGSVRFHEGDVEIIQSLQQNEWEVEILMEEVNIGDKYTPDPKPLLDAGGCLVLRRVTN